MTKGTGQGIGRRGDRDLKVRVKKKVNTGPNALSLSTKSFTISSIY